MPHVLQYETGMQVKRPVCLEDTSSGLKFQFDGVDYNPRRTQPNQTNRYTKMIRPYFSGLSTAG